ncbi:MAG: Cof-type HAD-IIB family hydrolase [Bacilli bacterium]
MKQLSEKKLIAFDLDGTLLTDKKRILFATKQYIKKAQKNNIFIVLSSGRPFRAMEKYYKQLKLNTPMICYNGAYVVEPNTNKIITERYFNRKIILDIYNTIPKDILLSAMSEDNFNIWVDENDEFLSFFYLKKGMSVHHGNFGTTLDKDVLTFIMKYVDTPNNRAAIKRIVTKFPTIDVRFWTCHNYCEIYFKDINKHVAIKNVAKRLGIKDSNIYAFGDNDNDVEMISGCANGVAMANSPQFVKDLTKNVTKKDNNHNGAVSYLIDNNIR